MADTFVKNNRIPGSSSVLCEAQGLKELARYKAQHGLNIPKLISETENQLVLERIRATQPSVGAWVELGRGLRALETQLV